MIDHAVSPCVDFYQYANGGWLRRAVIQPHDTAALHLWRLTRNDNIGVFNDMAHRTQAMLLRLLTTAQASAATTSDPETRVVGTFYGSCLSALQVGTSAERAWQCYAITDTLLRPALGHLYARAMLSPATRHRALAFVASLRAALQSHLQATPFMHDSTRAYALAKVAALTVALGAPEDGPDYTTLHLSPTDYEANLQTMHSFLWQQKLAAIGRPTPEAWRAPPYEINAAEHPDMLEIPAVLWQPPLFDATGDLATNYGGLGALIGHELLHGFGTVGRYFAANHVRFEWIFPADTAVFTQRLQRLVQQFNAFVSVAGPSKSDSVHVDGQHTLEENLADLGGLRVAYAAFQRALQEQPRKTMHGFTPEQRFFLAFANLHRLKLANGASGSDDAHAPAQFRVNGPLANMPEFAQAFGCHAGDLMVRSPDERVDVW
jgi:putative endopeptidase